MIKTTKNGKANNPNERDCCSRVVRYSFVSSGERYPQHCMSKEIYQVFKPWVASSIYIKEKNTSKDAASLLQQQQIRAESRTNQRCANRSRHQPLPSFLPSLPPSLPLLLTRSDISNKVCKQINVKDQMTPCALCI